MVAANAAVAPLLTGVADPALLVAPVSVLRLSLHPRGLAPHIANLPEWRAHLLERLRRQIEASADPVLASLLAELTSIDMPLVGSPVVTTSMLDPPGSIVVPLQLDTAQGRVSLISTITVLGTPLEVTLLELAIGAFYPADDATAERLIRLQRR